MSVFRRLVVLLRMSCLTGQSRHETRKKRCAVCTLLAWFAAKEEQTHLDPTFGVNHIYCHYVMERTGSSAEDALSLIELKGPK